MATLINQEEAQAVNERRLAARQEAQAAKLQIMKLHFQHEVKATLWPPCNTSHLPLPHGTRSFNIPAYSVIDILDAGLAYDGQIIARLPKGWSLHVDKNHHGNVNFFKEVYSSHYKPFDPIEATNSPEQY